MVSSPPAQSPEILEFPPSSLPWVRVQSGGLSDAQMFNVQRASYRENWSSSLLHPESFLKWRERPVTCSMTLVLGTDHRPERHIQLVKRANIDIVLALILNPNCPVQTPRRHSQRRHSENRHVHTVCLK